MALASLGGVAFRINPTDVAWNFEIVTAVKNTIGGRVVQVIGANLSDITVRGYYGQEYGKGKDGKSALLAEAFVKKMRQLMIDQSRDSNEHGGSMHESLDFVVPDFGWNMKVFLKGIKDEGGFGAISHSPDHFSYQYVMTLFPDQAGSSSLTPSGMKNGVLDKKRQAAIKQAVARISEGIGWKRTQFNDPNLIFNATTGEVTQSSATGQGDPNGGLNSADSAAAAVAGEN